uniref:Ketoreductase domain-containing protein n=1 Tax=uncultured bacterium Bio5 TaxID=460938 RepID=B2BKB1_9BACT|nr:unknown [uncultured bacterium Bio5]
MSSLSGQVAVVTGASRGIGAAIARKLGSLGARVVLTARDVEKLRAVEREIVAAGGEAESHACDLSHSDAIAAFATGVLAAHGRCDVLVNNAGVGWFGGPLHTMKPAEWDALIAVNLKAPYLLLRAFAPAMIAAKRGHIINISSLAGKNPVADGAAYTASKWGLNGLMTSAAEELRQHQVRVSLVAPGSVRTEFGVGLSAKKSALGAIEPDDIADVVALLATQADQSFISEVLVRPTLKK